VKIAAEEKAQRGGNVCHRVKTFPANINKKALESSADPIGCTTFLF
jgi:hypothetical protein